LTRYKIAASTAGFALAAYITSEDDRPPKQDAAPV
jgi:hypothetical protein